MEEKFLSYSDIEIAYRSIIIDHTEMVALSTGLALIFVLLIFLKEINKTAGEEVDLKKILLLLKENARIIAMIIILPWLLLGIEEILSGVSDAYIKQFSGGHHASMKANLNHELEGMMSKYSERFEKQGNDNWDKGFIFGKYIIDSCMVMLVKPFLILLDNWVYSFALVFRFIYLGIIKFTSGIAVACFLYEPTRVYFYTWVKNLIICYLLIPVFLFVTVFIDAIKDFCFQSSTATISALIFVTLLKLYGYKQGALILQRSL